MAEGVKIDRPPAEGEENTFVIRSRGTHNEANVVPTGKDRWKLLRQAVLRSKQESSSTPTTSLHSFIEYQLMVRLEENQETKNKRDEAAKRFLCRVDWKSDWMTESVAACSQNETHRFCDFLQVLNEIILGLDALNCSEKPSLGSETEVLEVHFLLQRPPCSDDICTAQKHCVDFLDDQKQVIETEIARFHGWSKCSVSAHLKDSVSIPSPAAVSLKLEFERRADAKKSGDAYKVQLYKCPSSVRQENRDANQHSHPLASCDVSKDSLVLYIRERMSRQFFSLQELASHNNDRQKVDNTGNVCIWDAEKTLTWALAQTQTNETSDTLGTVLELGIGMAGLAGLSLVNRAERIILTDGHEQCVQNNRINVRLLDAFTRTTDHDESRSLLASVECRVLLWTLETNVDETLQDCSDLTLVSDCTHFEHYHGHLLWTLLQCTKVSTGKIWMCQPERGRSLQNFLDLIQVVNGDTGHPLVHIHEPSFPRLQTMHEQFQGLHGGTADPFYRPNVHQPRILVLTKLRPLIEKDRSAMAEHIRNRQLHSS